MEARHRSWWQRTRKHLEGAIISIFLVGLMVLITLVVFGYMFNWDWTGLGAVNSEPKQHTKTLWDWLQLLIIPAVLTVGGYLFNFTVSRNEREIASDNQREAALKEYIDKMSELLLDKQLRESKPADEIRTIARVRTLTVLPRLDAARKNSVFQFLQESNLIGNNLHIVNLHGADLSGTGLSGANLSRTDLSEANLNGTYLIGADLSGTNLSGARLFGANLMAADLSKADLSGADLRGADLSGAKLFSAELYIANLRGADLSEADLSEANLGYADLRGALQLHLFGSSLPKGPFGEELCRSSERGHVGLECGSHLFQVGNRQMLRVA